MRSLIAVTVVILLIVALVLMMKWYNSRPVLVSGRVWSKDHFNTDKGNHFVGPFLLVSFRPLDNPADSKIRMRRKRCILKGTSWRLSAAYLLAYVSPRALQGDSDRATGVRVPASGFLLLLALLILLRILLIFLLVLLWVLWIWMVIRLITIIQIGTFSEALPRRSVYPVDRDGAGRGFEGSRFRG